MNHTSPTVRRLLTAASGTALLSLGVFVAGCDSEEEIDTIDPDDTVVITPGSDVDVDADMGGMFDTTVASVRAKIDEAMAGDGTAKEKLSQLLETGQETFDQLGEETSENDTVSGFFGQANEAFDKIQASVNDEDFLQAGRDFASLKDVEVPEMAKPYVQPFMNGVTELMKDVGASGVGNAITNGMNNLRGGDTNDAGPEEFDAPPE
jgi:hypothetical protein